MAQHRTKESRPRQGEVLIYKPAEGTGEIYGTKEGKTFAFDLKTSPGLNPDLLRPGIPVTYVTVQSDGGTRAVEVQLEEAGSLETRLRSTRKRLGAKPSRPAGMQAPLAFISNAVEAHGEATETAGEGELEAASERAAPDSADGQSEMVDEPDMIEPQTGNAAEPTLGEHAAEESTDEAAKQFPSQVPEDNVQEAELPGSRLDG